MNILKTSKTQLAVAILATAGLSSTASASLANYSQDHEGLIPAASDPLGQFELGFVGGEQYGIFADVWFGDVGTGVFLYSYGVFSAPNGGAGFSAVAGGEGGVDQGDQYLNIYSDYNNADHANGFNINTAVFQEQVIGAEDIGNTVSFSFDVKAPDTGGIAEPASNATASAFIKTLDQNNGYATTNDIRFDSTTVSNGEWDTITLTLDLTDPLLAGQLLQFGFGTVATNYEDSGVYYDNINFQANASAVPVPAAAWLFGSALVGLAGIGRKRSA